MFRLASMRSNTSLCHVARFTRVRSSSSVDLRWINIPYLAVARLGSFVNRVDARSRILFPRERHVDAYRLVWCESCILGLAHDDFDDVAVLSEVVFPS